MPKGLIVLQGGGRAKLAKSAQGYQKDPVTFQKVKIALDFRR